MSARRDSRRAPTTFPSLITVLPAHTFDGSSIGL
jgi:hypothetical protein